MTTFKLHRNIKTAFVALSLVFGFVLLSTVSVQAQYDRNRRDNRRINNRWGNTNKRAIENLIKRVEDSSDKFKRELDRELDRSRLNGTRREDDLNKLAKELEKATNKLRSEFDRSDSLQENRDEVERVMRAASQLNRGLSRARLGYNVTSLWNSLKRDLNTLARAYNVRGV
jgi:hypothetical protein